MSRREVSVEFRMTAEQRAAMHARARERGLSLQMLLETVVFGEIRPRERNVRPRKQDGELPLTA